MLVTNFVSLLALASIAAAVPPSVRPIDATKDIRLIRISEDDPGVWVKDEEIFDRYIAKKIKFVDVTDTWVRTFVLLAGCMY